MRYCISVHCRDFEQQTLQLQERQQSLLAQVASLQEANTVSSERAGDHPAYAKSAFVGWLTSQS